jgi:hypothetical protein
VSAYVIEVQDTKQGVMYPTIVGPFPDTDSAQAFADEMAMGTAAQRGDGGYSAVHIVDDDLCDYTPEQYRKKLACWLGDEA